MKNFYKYLLKFEIYSKGIFRSSLEGEINLKLLRLKEKCDINGFFNIELINKNQNPKLEIKIKIQKPLNGKNDIRYYFKKVFTIEKIIPSFNEYLQKKKEDKNKNINQNNNNLITKENKNDKKEQKNSKENNNKKIEPKNNINKNKTNPKNNTNNINKKPTENINVEIPNIKGVEPNKIKEFINNPNCIECLLSIKVLENASKKLKIKYQETVMSKNVRLFYNQIECYKKMIIEQINNGNLSKENYISLIEGYISRDKMLFDYFNKINDESKKKIIIERVKIMESEIKELK